MKKYLLIILILSGVFGTMTIAASAFAATNMLFAPANVSARQGQIFTLAVEINPQGMKNYTVKTELRYPADLLEMKSFTFANGWMPLSQSGYDLIDNTNGLLVKTAGYPGGASSAIAFGRMSFLAKKSGNGTIVLGGDSFALDANNQNVLVGAPVQTAVAILPPVAPPPAIPEIPATLAPPAIPMSGQAEKEKESTSTIQADQSETKALIAQEQPVALRQITSKSLLAAIGNLITLGTGSVIVGLLFAAAIFAFVGCVIRVVVRKARP